MKNQDGIKYVCPQCHTKEIIPQEAIEYVNAMDLKRCLISPSSFLCEKCGYPYMMSEGYYKEQFLPTPRLHPLSNEQIYFYMVCYTARKFLKLKALTANTKQAKF